MLRVMISYIFYDRIMTMVVWNEPETISNQRLETREVVTSFISEYLHVNDELR